MLTKSLSSLIAITILSLIIPREVVCQSKNLFGATSFIEKSSFSNLRVGFGASYERQLNSTSSIEIGLGYRSFLNDFSKNVSKNPLIVIEDNTILEKYLTIPLLY